MPMKLAHPFRLALPAALSLLFAACASTSSAQITATTQSPPPAGGLAELVDAAEIPFERFTLENGLTTIIHTDRKAPIVGVTVYYRVGSKHEPRGRTGFAHLFEHLMFVGSENVENFDAPLLAAGSTGPNGSTYYDRTNYVETVPTGALDLALFMESDRMGYLLGAVTQEKLDNQRAVVQNEKRQGDNQPYGLVRYLRAEGLLPVGHPYRHSTIGSMADLEAATLQDVRDWFRDNYAPNNVVLVLAGDIDAETARPMVERWFGAIPRGPEVEPVQAGPETLREAKELTVTDQVPFPALFQFWTSPGLNHPDAVPLRVGMDILGGLQSSRLDNALVRGAELAVGVSASASAFEQLGFLETRVNLKDGTSPEDARAALERETARLVAEGPTLAELERAKTQLVADAIARLEQVGGFGGKGFILAEGELYSDDPAFYRRELEQIVGLTPADVQQAMQRWLSRPAYTLWVVPGERTLDGATLGGWGDEDATAPPLPDARAPVDVTRTGAPRSQPPVISAGDLTFPQVQRATLSNGIEVLIAQRPSVPKVSLALTINAGTAADAPGHIGLHETMVDLLTEGTATKSALDIAILQEQLGSTLRARAGIDSDTITLETLTTNLEPSLALMADVVRNPAFRDDDVARVREQRLAAVAQELASPAGLASRAYMPLIYGADHPYANAGSSGDTQAIAGLVPADLATAHRVWFRPDLATIIAVGDVSLAELVPALESAFGDWAAPETPAPTTTANRPAPEPQPRLVVIDRPNSPSSFLLMGRATPLFGHVEGSEPILLATEVLGGGFLSRLNQDLRETKGWTYGIGSLIPVAKGQRMLQIGTQVQADRTADSIRAILAQVAAFPQERPVDPAEYQRATEGNILGLPNELETNGRVLGALLTSRRLGRNLDYQAQLPAIYGAIDPAMINDAAREYLGPHNMTIVVVGDRAVIDAQLETLAMPITYLEAEGL